MEFLTADYTFVNERLARHYGIPGVTGSHFRRVTLTDESRRGLLGQGSILTVTAYPHRTSPVRRGKWILENMLGTPPPPPPPNVPPLDEKQGGADVRSMRERMQQHRANAGLRIVPRDHGPARASRSKISTRSGAGGASTTATVRSTHPDRSPTAPHSTAWRG